MSIERVFSAVVFVIVAVCAIVLVVRRMRLVLHSRFVVALR